MTKDEVLNLALEVLEYIDLCDNDRDFLHPHECFQLDKAITAIKQARALDKMADNARELGLDYEPLREDWGPGPHEMHSLPAQRPFVGLDKETQTIKLMGLIDGLIEVDPDRAERFIESILARHSLQKRLREKNAP